MAKRIGGATHIAGAAADHALPGAPVDRGASLPRGAPVSTAVPVHHAPGGARRRLTGADSTRRRRATTHIVGAAANAHVGQAHRRRAAWIATSGVTAGALGARSLERSRNLTRGSRAVGARGCWRSAQITGARHAGVIETNRFRTAALWARIALDTSAGDRVADRRCAGAEAGVGCRALAAKPIGLARRRLWGGRTVVVARTSTALLCRLDARREDPIQNILIVALVVRRRPAETDEGLVVVSSRSGREVHVDEAGERRRRWSRRRAAIDEAGRDPNAQDTGVGVVFDPSIDRVAALERSRGGRGE